jgi:hypothetical protein
VTEREQERVRERSRAAGTGEVCDVDVSWRESARESVCVHSLRRGGTVPPVL